MSNHFAVDTARLAAASGDVERIAGTIDSEVRAMMASLVALQDCWQGSASARFQAVVQDWRATEERVTASLQQISSTLRMSGQDYEQVEQANRMRFTAG
ncbi:hypothetical protein GCM10009584_01730 [Ornithinimicrobium humiphilum]|uniref:ESAT-6-like protein n=1 Tax=Ornithinimicrobium humiphilum TaxID=125288 RepID=A0A543KRN0_9MICO|nr:WXG100 family type VII secretion target [Ornithinimicrobium humiphilum]TQM97736.1 WXG100 family type VII secretion target [Ornithinimicrobium humiphilum]